MDEQKQPHRHQQSRQDLSRARWTTYLTEKFATLLIQQIAQGNRSNNVFNKKAWKYVRDEFNKQTGHNFDRKQLKNHLDVLRKRYTVTKSLLDQTEFRWDESQQMVVADKEVWANYIKAHPEAESIKIKGCPIFKRLCLVFSESGIEGHDSTYDLKPDVLQIGCQQHVQHQFEQDQSRARWTEPLDKIFTDLMVDQVLQGNRIDNMFNKRAWKYIHDEFNRQTGLVFNRKQLKNHHNVLRRLYNNMKSLLDRNDFSWDETHCMVIAEEEVWEKYVMEHPEGEAIRDKGCPIYKHLCTIFSESVSGRYGQSSHNFESNKAVDCIETAGSSEESPETTIVSINPVTPTPSAQDEASSRSSGQNKRRPLDTPSISDHRQKRSCKRVDIDNAAAAAGDGMREMGSTTSRSRTTTVALLTQSVDQFSISNCVKVLNELQGVDQNLYLAALDLFEEPIRRETFISIRSDIRVAWLKGKCNVM